MAHQPCRDFVRASSPHQDQPLNSTIFLRARPFAFSLGSSKDQGLGNWLQVHDNCISRIKLQVASNLQHRTIDCGKSKPLSMCPSSTKGCLVKCPGFLLSCTSLRFPWRTFVLRIHEMFLGWHQGYTQVPSLPLLQRSIRPAWQIAMPQNNSSLLYTFVILTYTILCNMYLI